VPKETFWGLLTHFVYDITHFDGKFFSTIRDLIAKPGFLSLEYMRGRRQSYLNPIRMYVFTSAFFFLIFFTLYNTTNMMKSDKKKLEEKKEQLNIALKNLRQYGPKSNDSLKRVTAQQVISGLVKDSIEVEKQIHENETAAKNKGVADSLDVENNPLNTLQDSLKAQGVDIETGKVTYSPKEKGLKYSIDTSGTGTKLSTDDLSYRSIIAYQRMQEALPEESRDGWLKRNFLLWLAAVIEDTDKKGGGEYLRNLTDSILHSFPKMLFVSLPIFAFFLKLLYIRHKRLFYADHAIFTIHLYCATFIFLLGWFGLDRLQDFTNWGFITVLLVLSVFVIYFYMYKAMRRFYQQRRGKTITKFFLLNTMSFVMMLVLLSIFAAISAAKVTNGH
jgi:hypothetical protein